MAKKKRRRTDSRAITERSPGEPTARTPDAVERPVASDEPGRGTLIASSRSVTIKGPLPPPQLLQQYEEFVPGSADRIIRMAEKASEHEIQTGTRVVQGVFAERRRGQMVGAAVVLAVLACSGWTLYLGYEGFAMTLGGWTLVGVAAIFVLGRLPNWFRGFRGQKDETKPPGQHLEPHPSAEGVAEDSDWPPARN
ncbi:DUF2335 domain-containing protein [Candidatus Palauibacter sp.]|uniref:DUF2335 domain-containing protein n=1 Tax=Candidatus Palauibacter sp. TaxID=3101350 RepID=UPI003C6FA521